MNSKACVRIKGKKSDWFEIEQRLREEYEGSLWLSNIFMGGVLRKASVVFGGRGV